MTKRQYDDWRGRQRLTDAGWNVSKTDSIQFNAGSETFRHLVAKSAAAFYLKHDQGYRVDSEVTHPERGEIDILAWNADDIIAVECETAPTEEVITDKLERYYEGTPIRDVFVINVTEMPAEILPAYEWIVGEL